MQTPNGTLPWQLLQLYSVSGISTQCWYLITSGIILLLMKLPKWAVTCAGLMHWKIQVLPN
ncbi:hypothetical protein BJ165DRAFT_1426704 [Panaeolus papilionaceus]|nr:hypothetical protein BJ165DRAFT_1426704 [Panaeolus papilionaceus]